MNELTKRDNNLSLAERLKERKLGKKTCLLLDISGSMCALIEPEHRAIDALRNIVQGIVGNLVCITFNSQARLGTKNDIPEPSGGTVMSNAINLAKDQGFKEAIMITDGKDNSYDEEAALLATENFNLRIMYVGPGEKPEFLDKLAKKAGSFCTVEDLKKPKELTSKIQLLLADGNSETKKGPICL